MEYWGRPECMAPAQQQNRQTDTCRWFISCNLFLKKCITKLLRYNTCPTPPTHTTHPQDIPQIWLQQFVEPSELRVFKNNPSIVLASAGRKLSNMAWWPIIQLIRVLAPTLCGRPCQSVVNFYTVDRNGRTHYDWEVRLMNFPICLSSQSLKPLHLSSRGATTPDCLMGPTRTIHHHARGHVAADGIWILICWLCWYLIRKGAGLAEPQHTMPPDVTSSCTLFISSSCTDYEDPVR